MKSYMVSARSSHPGIIIDFLAIARTAEAAKVKVQAYLDEKEMDFTVLKRAKVATDEDVDLFVKRHYQRPIY